MAVFATSRYVNSCVCVYVRAACSAICYNCGTLNTESCRCSCADGWHGTDCSGKQSLTLCETSKELAFDNRFSWWMIISSSGINLSFCTPSLALLVLTLIFWLKDFAFLMTELNAHMDMQCYLLTAYRQYMCFVFDIHVHFRLFSACIHACQCKWPIGPFVQ